MLLPPPLSITPPIPLLPPIGAPIIPPTGAPIIPPIGAPIIPPIGAPIIPPSGAPPTGAPPPPPPPPPPIIDFAAIAPAPSKPAPPARAAILPMGVIDIPAFKTPAISPLMSAWPALMAEPTPGIIFATFNAFERNPGILNL